MMAELNHLKENIRYRIKQKIYEALYNKYNNNYYYKSGKTRRAD